MTKDVQAVRPDDSVAQVAEKFAKLDIHGAPVVDGEGKLLGIVTESDILQATKMKFTSFNMVYPSVHQFGLDFQQSVKYEDISKAFEEVKNTPVSKIMTKKVITAAPDDLVEEVAPMMVENHVNRVPVVDKGGKVVGIVTRNDVLRGLFKTGKSK
jgi:CBS domain-containing protein